MCVIDDRGRLQAVEALRSAREEVGGLAALRLAESLAERYVVHLVVDGETAAADPWARAAVLLEDRVSRATG